MGRKGDRNWGQGRKKVGEQNGKSTELALDALVLADAIDANNRSVANVLSDVAEDLIVALDGENGVRSLLTGSELPGALRRLSASVVRVSHLGIRSNYRD